MPALVLAEPGRLLIADDTPPPAPQPGEAQVRTLCGGVCGTDFHAFHGRQPFFTYPRVLGHELAVEVVAVGAGISHVAPGDRCAVEPYVGCLDCAACRMGKTNCCARLAVLGVHIDGGLRSTWVLPARQLHPANGLDPERLALVEPLVIGAHGVRRAAVGPSDVVLIAGAGPIGLAASQAAKAAGARVALLEREPSRRDRAASFGVPTVLAPADDPSGTETVVGEALGGLPTVVIDATGNEASMNGALRLAASGGRVVFLGLHRGSVTFEDAEFHRREVTLLASRNGTASDFAWVIEGLRSGALDVARWVTDRLSPEDLPRHIARLADPGAGGLKALVRFS